MVGELRAIAEIIKHHRETPAVVVSRYVRWSTATRCTRPCLRPWEVKRFAMSRASDGEGLRQGHLTFLPVAAGRMEFAIEVRKAIVSERPDVVAVELPVTLEKHYRAAVAINPNLAEIHYNYGVLLTGQEKYRMNLGPLVEPVRFVPLTGGRRN